jgi:hypothetical protein
MAATSSLGWRALVSGSTLADRLVLLVMVEVAGVVAHLVHVGRDLGGQPVVLLQVDDQVRARLLADVRQRRHVFRVVDRDAHHVAAGLADGLGLGHGRVDVLGAGRAHALHGHGLPAADHDVPDPHRAGGVPFRGHFAILTDAPEAA